MNSDKILVDYRSKTLCNSERMKLCSAQWFWDKLNIKTLCVSDICSSAFNNSFNIQIRFSKKNYTINYDCRYGDRKRCKYKYSHVKNK